MLVHVLMAESYTNEGRHLVDVRELSNEDIERLSSAKSLAGWFNAGFSLYELCEGNYNNLIVFYDEVRYTKGTNGEDAHALFIEMNRYLINYLSSFRTFIDHQETMLKRLPDAEQNYYRTFKDRTAYHYDNSFSYRFLWRLRNYVQHCGLPLGGMKIEGTFQENGIIKPHLWFYFNRDDLISLYDGWSTIKDDLSNQPNLMDVMPHVKELQVCLRNLADTAAMISISRLDTNWDFLLDSIHEVQAHTPHAVPVVCIWDVEPEQKPRMVTMQPFPMHIMKNLVDTWLRLEDETKAEL